jgi:putative tricarboxylic transport membrane protein
VSPVTIEVSPLPSAGTDDALFSVLQDPSVNDGYIMGLITNSSVVSTATGAAPFEFTDLQGIATIAQVPIGFAVRADSPWATFEEFAEAATADASNIRMGLTGTPGSLIHIASEQMGQAVGIAGQFAIVPGETSGQAILDLIGGGVDIVTGAASGFVEDVTAGNLRVLATTGPERMTPLPDAPTLQELGYDITIVNPLQLVTSSQVPDEIIEWLSDLVGEAMAVSGVEDEIAGTGWSPFFQDADATQARMDDMYQRASSLAESLGLSG